MIGKFISFEGPDGAGKTSNVEIAANHLRHIGYKVLTTREPGGYGVRVAEMLRELLLSPPNAIDHRAELFLFAAARAEHIAKLIKPALEKGTIVISDRFADSTYAYQAHGRGLDPELVESVERLTLNGFQPDHTLFFDLPLEECARRLADRQEGANHFDRQDASFRARVYIGYQKRFLANPQRMFRIDALPEPSYVAQQVRNWINAHFEPLN